MAVDPVVELWKQPLSRGKQAMTTDADLPAVAVAGEDQVDGIPGEDRIVFGMMVQKHLVPWRGAEALQKTLVQFSRHLFAGEAAEQDAADLHTAVVQQGYARFCHHHPVFLCQVQLMVAPAEHHRSNLSTFPEETVAVFSPYCGLFRAEHSTQPLRRLDSGADQLGRQASVTLIQILTSVMPLQRIPRHSDDIRMSLPQDVQDRFWLMLVQIRHQGNGTVPRGRKIVFCFLHRISPLLPRHYHIRDVIG